MIRYAEFVKAQVNPSIEFIRLAVTKWAKSHPEIISVALFGSRSRGSARPDSDADLAVEVVGSSGEDADTRFFFESESWKCELKELLDCPVSMVQLADDGRPEIQEAIARDGIGLYTRPSTPR